ncbi:RDD family protein [Peribacillus acanthi]|uniref:RDD family protein n=1 Tax=Peribacillus acanthi TaxID=2171554 RepID=UPI001F0BCB27|nr:RDD family protein [Peribacillus acanthi]
MITGIVFYVINGEYLIEWTRTYSWQLIYTLYLTTTPVIWSGYIIGKRLFRIKVKRIDEGKVTIKNMILREFISNYLLSTNTFGISAIISTIMIIFRDDKRGIHDIIGGTYVTSE